MSNTFASLRQKRFGDASVFLLALLVFGSVVAFAIYYYMDRRVGSTGPTPIEMQIRDGLIGYAGPLPSEILPKGEPLAK